MSRLIGLQPHTALHSAMQWQTVKANAEFQGRDSCSCFQHDGHVYLSSGYQVTIPPNNTLILRRDLWRSRDGIDWQLVLWTTPYQAFAAGQSYNGAIIAMDDKVWRSLDGGYTWEVALEVAPVDITSDTKYTYKLVQWLDRLVLVGGGGIWWSDGDLTDWTFVAAPWGDRWNFGAAAFKGHLYLTSGNNDEANDPPEAGYVDRTSFNDVWRSPDPLTAGTWTRVVENAPWTQRMWPGFCVHGEELVISAGYKNRATPTNFIDTFASRDGVTWREIDTTAGAYSFRHYPALFSLNGRLFISGGNRNPNQAGTVNDVLELVPA